MKKLLGLTITILTSISLVACKGDNNSTVSGMVNFHTGYEDLTIESVKPGSNGKISEPEISKTGYTIYGYYADESFETKIDFSEKITVNNIYLKVLKGEGSETSPYLIESGLSLNAVTHHGQELTSYVEISKDLTVVSHFTEDYQKTIFNGKLDGKGHTITLKEEGNDTGLFFKVGEQGQVSNLSLVGNIVGTQASTGGVVNVNYGTISNVTTIGTSYHATNGCENGVSLMTVFDEDDNSIVLKDYGTLGELATLSKGGAGAISGTNYGTIKDCQNKMRVSATIGAGSMAGINYGLIEGCFNQGAIGASGNNAVNSTTIRDNNFSFSYLGGMAGANYGEIHQCANLNQVFVARLPWLYGENPAGQSDLSGRIRVGGIAGYNYSEYDATTDTYTGGKITECVNYGRVHGDMQVGGIAGYSNGYVADCFFSGLIGGRNSVGGIVGWQPGDREGDNPGLVTNCASLSRIVEGKANTVYDENDNSFVVTELTNKSSGKDSNVSDYFKTAKYASNCVYHNNSGNIDPTDYKALLNEEEEVNTSISSRAVMESKVYDQVGYKDGVETNLWEYKANPETTAMVGIAKSWQVYLNLRLKWQTKTIIVKQGDSAMTISGVAGVDYINTILTATDTEVWESNWNANLSGAIPGRGLPSISVGNNEKLIWVTKENDASTEWDGLLRDDITIYPMKVALGE